MRSKGLCAEVPRTVDFVMCVKLVLFFVWKDAHLVYPFLWFLSFRCFLIPVIPVLDLRKGLWCRKEKHWCKSHCHNLGTDVVLCPIYTTQWMQIPMGIRWLGGKGLAAHQQERGPWSVGFCVLSSCLVAWFLLCVTPNCWLWRWLVGFSVEVVLPCLVQ